MTMPFTKENKKIKKKKVNQNRRREEAEKQLPEVSQDMYYNITTDLKEIFQSMKNTDEKGEDTPWNDDDCGRGETGKVSNAAALTHGAEQASGFTFSFFDSDTKDIKEDTYRIEPVKCGTVVFQEDPRFQDSSSEEEDVTKKKQITAGPPLEKHFLRKRPLDFSFSLRMMTDFMVLTYSGVAWAVVLAEILGKPEHIVSLWIVGRNIKKLKGK
ncbi:nucleolar protein 8 [Sigmodon hispidus]